MPLLLTICMLHLVAQFTPGPDVLLIAKSSAATSLKNTLKIILGISIGILVWVLLTLVGFSILLQQFPWIQQILMLIGGGFLAHMGWGMLRGGLATRNQSFDLETTSENTTKNSTNYFILGLLTNLSNPKTLIYFSSVFSLALSSTASSHLKTQLAIIIPIQTLIVFSLFMLIMSMPKIKAAYQRSGGYIDIASGVLFLVFAIVLWAEVILSVI